MTRESCLLVVTRSSNPEGRAVQSAVNESGRSVENQLLVEIGALNARLAPGEDELGPIGAVVGPTHIEPALDLPVMRGLFLAPASAHRVPPLPTWHASSPLVPIA